MKEKYNDPPSFFDWFVKNCTEAVKTTMLKPAAGFGNPPQPFYTNDTQQCH